MRFLIFTILILGGCNKTTRPILQLERFGENQTALYVVEGDGTIEFGGGIDALSGKTTWEGQLTDAQLSKLQELIATENLQTEIVIDSKRFEIVICNTEDVHRYVVPISNPSASELYFFLEESTMQRIQAQLDALPKPTMDVISDRKVKGSNVESH